MIIHELANKCIQLITEFQNIPHPGYLVVSDKKEIKNIRPKDIKGEESKGNNQKNDVAVDTTETALEVKKKEDDEKYFDFSPLKLTCHAGKKSIEISTYNAAVDTYFKVMASKI